MGKLHRERAVTGRIFQALPTHTDTTTVAFIYKIAKVVHPKIIFCPFGIIINGIFTTWPYFYWVVHQYFIGCEII
jgi:hypothetical protein